MKRSELFSVKPMPEESKDIENYYNLWRAVLDHAVQDYSYTGESEEGLKYKKEVEKWLKYKYESFKEICELAAVDHARARKEFEKYKEGEYDRNREKFRTIKKSK